MAALEPCSKSEFADFVRDFNLTVEMDIAPDRVVMRYVNQEGTVCASSKVDLRFGVESDWKIDRLAQVERGVEQPAEYVPERKARTRGPRPTDDELFKCFSDGQSVIEISEKYGIPKVYVYRRLWSHPDYLNRKYNRIQEMVDLHLSGVSNAKIAEIYGVSINSVSARLVRWGYSREKSRINEKIQSEIIELYLSGVSIAKIAQQYGVSRQRISQRLRAAGYRQGDRTPK